MVLANGVIVRAAGDALALCPPFIIEYEQIDQLFDRLGLALGKTHAELRQRGVI